MKPFDFQEIPEKLNRELLLSSLESAFSEPWNELEEPNQVYDFSHVRNKELDPERLDHEELFCGKKWNDVSIRKLSEEGFLLHDGMLPDSLYYYIPAILLACINYPDSDLSDGVAFQLISNLSEKLESDSLKGAGSIIQLRERLSVEESFMVFSVLAYILYKNDPDNYMESDLKLKVADRLWAAGKSGGQKGVKRRI
jgi:hypothetical protein